MLTVSKPNWLRLLIYVADISSEQANLTVEGDTLADHEPPTIANQGSAARRARELDASEDTFTKGVDKNPAKQTHACKHTETKTNMISNMLSIWLDSFQWGSNLSASRRGNKVQHHEQNLRRVGPIHVLSASAMSCCQQNYGRTMAELWPNYGRTSLACPLRCLRGTRATE